MSDGLENIRALCADLDKRNAEIKRLRAAIKKHKAMFPDEPLSGELELWKVLDNG